ncbi:hypothetical protein ACA910_014516 [Epithemia clementina (nom. ined.)]
MTWFPRAVPQGRKLSGRDVHLLLLSSSSNQLTIFGKGFSSATPWLTQTCRTTFKESNKRHAGGDGACRSFQSLSNNNISVLGTNASVVQSLDCSTYKTHRQSLFSTNATALTDYEIEEEDEHPVDSGRNNDIIEHNNVVTINHSNNGASILSMSTSTLSSTQRPRLSALRTRLQEEDDNESNHYKQTAPYATKQKINLKKYTPTTLNHPPRTTVTNPTTSPNLVVKTPSAFEMKALRQWIQTLPEVPSRKEGAVLTDRFHRRHTYLRLSLTERCNLRCTYCMPEKGVSLQPPSHLLQTPELLQLARYFAQHGVTKFRLTGGEPTLRSDLGDIVQGLSALNPKQIGMTTNGIVLALKLSNLVDSGLNSVNVSLDTLQVDKFARLTRRPGTYLRKVWETLEACQDLSASSSASSSSSSISSYPQEPQGPTNNNTVLSFKINCVVMRDVNTDEIADFVRLTQTFPHASVRFIEYMPFAQNGWNGHKLVPYRELLTSLSEQHGIDLIPVPSDDPSDTSKWYTTPWAPTNQDDDKNTCAGKIGFITSMSNHFCGTCNRLRLTADGQLKVCLFDGKTELSLRDALRSGFTDEELSKAIYAAVQQKHYKLGGHIDPTALAADVDTNRPMTLIGG